MLVCVGGGADDEDYLDAGGRGIVVEVLDVYDGVGMGE